MKIRKTGSINFSLLLLTVVGQFLFSLAVTGQTEMINLPWKAPLEITEGESVVKIPNLDNVMYQDGLPFFSHQSKAKLGKYHLEIDLVNSEPAHPEDINVIERSTYSIPNEPIIKTGQERDGKDVQLQAWCIPYFKDNGVLKRITGFRLTIQYTGALTASKEKDYVSSSVLSSGDWYKISVPADGVYKIDKALLTSLGIDVENLNPQNLNVYGNAFGVLSEANSGAYIDDLTKNSIVAVGELDGVFNDDDYFMFYGAGPNRWDSALGVFTRKMNPYSNVNCYFIHIDATDAPQRIQSLAENGGAVTDNVVTYSYYDIHEKESTNLVKGGQRWYGELFDGELSQSFAFSVPDYVNDQPFVIRYGVANNGTTGGNQFNFFYNGSNVSSIGLSTGGGDYARNTGTFQFNPVSSTIPITVVLNRVNASVKGYLDYLELNGRRNLKLTGTQMQFRDYISVGAGNISRFTVSGLNDTYFVWDITNKRNPYLILGTLTGNDFAFTQATDSLREFITFNTAGLLTPTAVGAVENQDLHASPQVEYVIVTHPNFLSQANRLSALHEANGTSTLVVTTEQIYNEYSSGVVDATAIRRFMKMFYDRAAGDPALAPQSLLLFGDGTYDPKNRVGNNNYYVPTYQFLNSENHSSAMVCDDYFGILADNGTMAGSDLMQIGVGRLLISNQDQAKEQVDKIEHYLKNGSQLFNGGANECCMDNSGSTFGDWRNNYVLITDDEENGYFVNQDAEPASDEIYTSNPELNCDKLYSDAFVQTSTAGGERYPDVYAAISDKVERGSLLLNYIGHGGEVGAAEERIITIPQIQSWDNINKLNCFVTATCEFTRFDDPSRVSAGEWVSLNPTGGSIALMTTTRTVTFNVNTATVATFYEYVFSRDANNQPLTFGEIMRLTKNNSGTSDNRRSFMLIGDPHLQIALPRYKLVVDSINHLDPQIELDTIRALSKAHIAGHFEDFSGNVMTSLNGVLAPTIFDKPKVNYTLHNDPESPVLDFYTQKNAVYKGQASIKNGLFNFEFIVPKDISYSYGKGKISLYGWGNGTDATGLDTNFIIGGLDASAPVDNVGPDITLYLNDNNFVNGGITSESPLLVVETSDEYGINTVGNGVGHDLVAILDGNTSDPIVLNDYYVGDLDSYQSGKIRYTLNQLEVGKHYLEVKIWDANNNSNTARIDFEVRSDDAVSLSHVLNYPNPFTTNTTFFFEHNQSCSSLDAQIQIYTVSGKLVKTINETVPTQGFRVEGISWDGKDDFGDPLAKGVYVYRLSVDLEDGGKAEKVEKLVLLK